MKEGYIKDSYVIDKNDNEKTEELIKSIIRTGEDLNLAYNNFEYAEKGLIDYYSYNIKAYQIKLDYLISQAKDRGIIVDNILQRKIYENWDLD